jgi:hypothetical protein
MVDESSAVNPVTGGIYILDFGPGYIWKAVVTEYVTGKIFELKMTEADPTGWGRKLVLFYWPIKVRQP